MTVIHPNDLMDRDPLQYITANHRETAHDGRRDGLPFPHRIETQHGMDIYAVADPRKTFVDVVHGTAGSVMHQLRHYPLSASRPIILS